MRLRYFAAGLAAFVLCGWIPGPQGSGGSSGGAGVSFSADPLLLDDGAGIQTYLSAGAADGYALVGTTDGGVNGFVGAFGFYDGNNSTRHFSINATSGLDLAMDMSVRWSDNAFHSGGSKDLYLRRSAASTLTVDSDGAGGAATLAVDKVSLSSAANATSPFTLSFGSRGMWRDGGSRIALGSGSGSSAVALSTTLGTEGVRLASGNSLVWSDTTNASGGSADTYLVRDSANVLRLDGDGSAGTAAKLAVSGVAPMTSGQTLVLYDQSGASALTVGTTGALTAANPFRAPDGSVSAPAYSFSSDTNTGFYLATIPYIGFNGIARMAWGNPTTQHYNSLLQRDDTSVIYGTGSDVFEQGEQTASLSEGSANTVFSLVTADGDYGGLVIHYSIRATDGSDFQTETGYVEICYIDTSGGVSVDVDETVSPAAVATSGALSTTWSVVTTDDQSLEVQVTPSSTVITPSSIDIVWKVTCRGDVSLTVP